MSDRSNTTLVPGGHMRRRTARLGGALATTVLLAATMTGAAGAQEPSGEISFFGWDVADLTTGLGKGFEAARVAFQEANPGVTVTFDAVPFGDFVSAATTRARAGELGDVVEMLPGLNHAPVFDALAPTTQADWGALGEELTGWAGGVIDPGRPDDVRGRAHRRPGCHLVLQQGAVRAGRPRPRGAARRPGRSSPPRPTRSRPRASRPSRHRASTRSWPGGRGRASRPSTSPRRTSSGSAPGRSRSTTRACSRRSSRSRRCSPTAGGTRTTRTRRSRTWSRRSSTARSR